MTEGPPTSVATTRTAGRVAGCFLWIGGAATAANSVAAGSSGDRLAFELGLAALVVVVATAAMVAPWERWGARAPLALLPVGFVSLGYSNYATPQPYLASVSFVVIGVWAGLFQPRHTTVALAPVLAVAFWLPLRSGPEYPGLTVATFVVTAVAVVVGESLALLRARLEGAQADVLASRERRFSTLVERSGEVVIIFDTEGSITYVSPAAGPTFGYDPAEMEGRPVLEFIAGNVDQVERPSWAALLDEATESTAQDVVTETRIRHADGHWIEVETVGQDRTDDPDIGGFVYNIRDVDARRQLERRLQRQAFFDELTDLPNRAHFMAHLGTHLQSGPGAAVLFVDLDGFKVVNDSAGHDVGDELLKVVAERLKPFFAAPGRLLARFGGDEFVALLPTADQALAHEVAEGVIDVLEQPLKIGPRRLAITASIGIASDHDAATPDELIRAADIAMYVAKGSSPDRVIAYRAEMRADLVARVRTETDLRQAIDQQQLVLHYQPLVALDTEEIVGAEALVRWRHPTDGILAPARFIDVAEATGLIVPLGRWVIQEACEAAARWLRPGGTPLNVALNVSPRQFQDPNLVTDVADALLLSGLEPSRVKIEVTESVLVADIDAARHRLAELSALGVRLALDDFGTGYSSLGYLQTLAFDVLKIDRSFIERIAEGGRDLALVRTIHRLGHDLDLVTLAEGVETTEQADLLRDIGVDHAQGYLWSRPVPEAELVALLAAPADASAGPLGGRRAVS